MPCGVCLKFLAAVLLPLFHPLSTLPGVGRSSSSHTKKQGPTRMCCVVFLPEVTRGGAVGIEAELNQSATRTHTLHLIWGPPLRVAWRGCTAAQSVRRLRRRTERERCRDSVHTIHTEHPRGKLAENDDGQAPHCIGLGQRMSAGKSHSSNTRCRFSWASWPRRMETKKTNFLGGGHRILLVFCLP